jgi:hypothetical protein
VDRIYFSRGLRGAIARRIQSELLGRGFFAGSKENFADGIFGGHTAAALISLQSAYGLRQTGSIDIATWSALTNEQLPQLFERCLGVTAAFEGHGYGLAKGNFDGAGLTWGIIGFTLSNGEIQRLTMAAEAKHAGILSEHLRDLYETWVMVCGLPRSQAVVWADALSTGPYKEGLASEWLTAFARLGDDPRIRQVQRESAFTQYFQPAVLSAKKLGLSTELGLALAFDVHVQNGGFKDSAFQVVNEVATDATQQERRNALADAVTASTLPRWRVDVRARKETFAQATGVIHGERYDLNAWGLDDSVAPELLG